MQEKRKQLKMPPLVHVVNVFFYSVSFLEATNVFPINKDHTRLFAPSAKSIPISSSNPGPPLFTNVNSQSVYSLCSWYFPLAFLNESRAENDVLQRPPFFWRQKKARAEFVHKDSPSKSAAIWRQLVISYFKVWGKLRENGRMDGTLRKKTKLEKRSYLKFHKNDWKYPITSELLKTNNTNCEKTLDKIRKQKLCPNTRANNFPDRESNQYLSSSKNLKKQKREKFTKEKEYFGQGRRFRDSKIFSSVKMASKKLQKLIFKKLFNICSQL